MTNGSNSNITTKAQPCHKVKKRKSRAGDRQEVDFVKEESFIQQLLGWERPKGTAACKDSGFVLEEDGLTKKLQQWTQCHFVIDASVKSYPIIYVSREFSDGLEYQAEQLLGKSLHSLSMDGSNEKLTDIINCAIEGQVQASEHAVKDAYGAKITQYWTLIPVREETVRFIMGIANETKEEHDQLQIALQRQKGFVGTQNVGATMPVIMWDKEFLRLMGYEQELPKGVALNGFCGPETNQKNLRYLIQKLRSEESTSAKLLFYRNDGQPKWCCITSIPIEETTDAQSAKADKMMLSFVIDVTTYTETKLGRYILGKVLGQGASGCVRLGKNSQSGELFAVKSVNTSTFTGLSDVDQMLDEIRVMTTLKHPNIVRLHDVMYHGSHVYLIMDYAAGGSLVDYIYGQYRDRQIEEQEAQRIFLQIISALDYCHRRWIIHRDLKPENLLMDANYNIKIADFGFAAIKAPYQNDLQEFCGTPEFAAPEIISGQDYKGPAVDIWSTGVILYEMLTGQLPFNGPTQTALFKSIMRGIYDPIPSSRSKESADLIDQMLQLDAQHRITTENILKHPWCKEVWGDKQSPDKQMSLEVAGTSSADEVHDSLKLVVPDVIGSVQQLGKGKQSQTQK